MHRDPVVSSLLKSAASNKDHWCVVRWDPAQICIGKPSRWERWGGWSDGGGESDIFWVVRLRVREVKDNGYWWKSLVISEISWNLEKVTYSKLRLCQWKVCECLAWWWTGLSRGPMILCHRTPTSWAPKSIWDVFERRIVRGAFWKAGHHVHSYYLLWSKELLPNGSWKPLQYKQESLEWLPHYLLFKSQFHPLTESFTDVRFPPQKKNNNFVSTNSAPHGSSCYPESSILNPNPCIVRASFGHSIAPESPPKRTAPKTKREDIILLLNKVLGDEARWDEGIKQLHWLDVESVLLFCGVPPEYVKHPFEGAMVNGWMFPVKRHPKQI